MLSHIEFKKNLQQLVRYLSEGRLISAIHFDNLLYYPKNASLILNTTYIDVLVIHTPSSKGDSDSTDPYCQSNGTEYNVTKCRQST